MTEPISRLNAALSGRYTIERELGEGGMAIVYLAEDLKHEREVALKVLKPELAAVVGAERFLSEIKVTANLKHPHILPLFDSGEADGFLFYVMPYLEGESLRDTIDREKQLPVDEAVRIVSAVGNALDYAHRNDVIHRDIKPANILLQDGEPVVADFGIALAVGAAGSNRLTETGLSLGTPYYMSPEQATGDQVIGASTDTYALGSVLYEMLVGEPPYPGTTAQAVLGKIIAGKPVSATEQRPSIPANVDAAVRKALEKLPADRFKSAQDFVKALSDEHFRYGEEVAGAGVATGPWNRLTMTFAALFVVATVIAIGSLRRPEPPQPLTRVSVRIPEDQAIDPTTTSFAIAADGSLIVYRGFDGEGQPRLWVRRWDALEATPIPGTEFASGGSISPDRREVAFSVGGSLRVVPLEGGVVRTLTDTPTRDTRWSPDGVWIYYDNSSQGLSRVLSSGGGVPEVLTEVDIDAGDALHQVADVLPGNHALYTVWGPTKGGRTQVVNAQTGESKDVTTGTHARYSNTGHLLFLDATTGTGTLLAAPFDLRRMEITNSRPQLPVETSQLKTSRPEGNFAISQTGALMYQTQGSTGFVVTPVWVERDGAVEEIDPGWSVRGDRRYTSLALSPNGDRLAVSIEAVTLGRWDLWVKQLDTGPFSRLTSEGFQNFLPTWSSDGQSLSYASTGLGILGVRADGMK